MPVRIPSFPVCLHANPGSVPDSRVLLMHILIGSTCFSPCHSPRQPQLRSQLPVSGDPLPSTTINWNKPWECCVFLFFFQPLCLSKKFFSFLKHVSLEGQVLKRISFHERQIVKSLELKQILFKHSRVLISAKTRSAVKGSMFYFGGLLLYVLCSNYRGMTLK